MKSYLSVDIYFISRAAFLNGSVISRKSILTTDMSSIYFPRLLLRTTERRIMATSNETTETASSM